jgi:signal peptidase I
VTLVPDQDPLVQKVASSFAEESKTSTLISRVAERFIKASYFKPGDIVLYGKYKNHRGIVKGFGQDKWGNPTVEIEPIPKGRKQNKIFGLFRIWRADVKEKALAEQKAQEKDNQLVNRVTARFIDGEP